MKKFLILLLLIPGLSWGEDLVNKKITCKFKEIKNEIPLLSSKYIDTKNYNKVHLFRNQIPLKDFNIDWLIFGYEFLPDNQIKFYDSEIREYTKVEEDSFTKINKFIKNFFTKKPKPYLVQYPMFSTYKAKGLTGNDIYVDAIREIIERVDGLNTGERVAFGMGYDFFTAKNLLVMWGNKQIRFEYDTRSLGEPTYHISIDVDGDGQFMALLNQQDNDLSYKPQARPNTVFGEFFHTSQVYEYYVDEEKINITDGTSIVGVIDRYSLSYNSSNNYSFSSCEITQSEIVEKFNTARTQTRDYFKSKENYERTYYQKYEKKEEIPEKDPKDRKI